MDIQVGMRAKDRVTGFEGLVTGHADYITGCDQFLLQPAVKKGGDWQEGRWFDENRLVVTRKARTELQPRELATNGADTPAPVK